MTRSGLPQVVHTLRGHLSPVGEPSSDCELLQRFIAAADEAAFTRLVHRHGPMVFGVCRRLLRQTQDAEDAFQATFLILARKAPAVRRPEGLAAWLHLTARRVALRLRTRQRLAETLPGDLVAPEEPDDPELAKVLDEEISRLPEKVRLVVVLCYLEGRSTAEVAELLGCPQGTVFSRLASARERLRLQLNRRGVAPVAVAPTLTAGLARAAVAFTVHCAPEAGLVPARVLSLSKGVLLTMSLSKFQGPLALLLLCGTLLIPAGLSPRPAVGPAVLVAAAPRPAVPAVVKPDEEVSVATMPPVVVKTVPQAGDTEVDAAKVTEIRVTFSKDMKDGGWSWTQISAATFPKPAGKIRYEKDKRTCVMPVKLEPGKTYVVWLNPVKFQGFRDADGRPAGAYQLVFQTKP